MTSAQHTLGQGRLSWHAGERHTDRYGAVWLAAGYDGEAPPVELELGGYAGRAGALFAEVIDVRWPGDEKARVGEVVELGTGVLFTEPAWKRHGITATAVGVKPVDGRAVDWMSSMALYRVHNHLVRLLFEPAADPHE